MWPPLVSPIMWDKLFQVFRSTLSEENPARQRNKQELAASYLGAPNLLSATNPGTGGRALRSLSAGLDAFGPDLHIPKESFAEDHGSP